MKNQCGRGEVADLLRLDLDSAAVEMVDFIRRKVGDSHTDGVVIGLSGGVDSSLVVTLSVRALGKDRVLGVLMPTEFTPKQDIDDALEVAKWLGIGTKLINIQGISEAFFNALGCDHKNSKYRIPMANIRARIRMTILYYHANLLNYLVAGTGDRSESLIGYFTKYGDGGVDFLPIGHLYKTQVRELARSLGVPERIAYKPSSPQLYPGHRATDEIPLDYDRLDPVLVMLFDQNLSPEEVSKLTAIPLGVVRDVVRRFNGSKHKRAPSPTLRTAM